jgi:hypothetical protein
VVRIDRGLAKPKAVLLPPSSYLLASANRVSVLGQHSGSPFLDFVTSFIGSTWAGGAGRVGQGMERQGNRKESHGLKVMDRKERHGMIGTD